MKNTAHPIRDYWTTVLNGMAWGLFSSLLIGLIIKQIGSLTHISLLITMGSVAQKLMGPAIGVGIAAVLDAPALVVLSAVVLGALGAGSIAIDAAGVATIGIGEPVGAFVAALAGVEVGRRVAGKTPVDIVLVPFVTIVTGGLAGFFLAPYISDMMNGLGDLINRATQLQPIPMGIVLSVLMGMILTLPISSAALSISLGLSGLAAGAATVGCCCNMIGFAVISYRDNGFGGSLAQGIGTSMLQMPNIIKKPVVWLPAIVSSAILGPISTAVLGMTSNASGAGMGTSGLVGQFAMLDVMGHSPSVLLQMGVMHFLAPAVLSYAVYRILCSWGWISSGDLQLAFGKKGK
ncbi:PTS transporter subunit IIC [Murdochiella massiliensis]|uniref:PTS transporter subunit IIC n=1 Tax=Murdochiella massiliensis TaxID=1673723 RepID=UPI000ABD06D9|nr:PTS sugar transporter subunit IIC [Murdochiella massiliensis]